MFGTSVLVVKKILSESLFCYEEGILQSPGPLSMAYNTSQFWNAVPEDWMLCLWLTLIGTAPAPNFCVTLLL